MAKMIYQTISKYYYSGCQSRAQQEADDYCQEIARDILGDDYPDEGIDSDSLEDVLGW